MVLTTGAEESKCTMAMTIEGGTRDLFVEACRAVGKSLGDMVIGELGNQRIKTYTDIPGMDRAQSAKSVLTWLGARHLSLDSNGRDGAVTTDLSKPLTDEDQGQPKGTYADFIGNCDLVTNCGTSEHVRQGRRQPSGQYWCFNTVDKLCRVGGIMAHGVPMTGTSKGHGHWKYSVEWFSHLSHLTGYEIVKLYTVDNHIARPSILVGAEVYVFAILRKKIMLPTFPTMDAWIEPASS